MTDTSAARSTDDPKASGFSVEPETVLPSQFFEGVQIDASLQPEKRLMLAVLEDAVGTFQKYASAPGRRARRLFAEAEEWFNSDDTSWPFSFVNICQSLNLEHVYVRTGLHRWRAGQRGTARILRFPFRRVNGRRHSITGRPVGLRRSA